MAIQIGVPPIIPSARPSDETPPRHVAAAEVALPTNPAHLGRYVGIENHGDEKTCLSNLN